MFDFKVPARPEKSFIYLKIFIFRKTLKSLSFCEKHKIFESAKFTNAIGENYFFLWFA